MVVGWGHHFVSKRRYHLIIPREHEWTNKLMGEQVLELNTHLLHGMIHCNGFGHLLCINGKAEHPTLSGDELMGIWDQLCTILGVRAITVHDMLKKGPMDLRLLCGVAYGRSWFGKWGYRFCRGSFGVDADKYNRAISFLFWMYLDDILEDLSGGPNGVAIRSIVHRYREATGSSLVTLSDLLKVMLSSHPTRIDHERFLSELDDGLIAFPETVSLMQQQWPVMRLKHAAKVIASMLKEHRRTSMTSQELRDALPLYIRDPSLIDYVLKHIDSTAVGNQVIRRQANPRTRTLEFTLQDVASVTLALEKLQMKDDASQDFDVYRDILFLYENVLYGYPEDHRVSIWAQTVFDSKHFIKEWPLSDSSRANNSCSTNVLCGVVPVTHDLITKFTRHLPPAEIIRIPKHGDLAEIKLAAQSAFRDMYFVTDQFVATDIAMRGPGLYSIRGSGMDSYTGLRYECGGLNDRKVDCICGARDDDGERMAACDACQVWQHMLCIQDNSVNGLAPTFRCWKCKGLLG